MQLTALVCPPPHCICSQSKDQKICDPLGNQGLTAYWGREKWQTTKPARLPKFPVLIFSLARGRWLTTRFSGRAEGRISDVFRKATPTPSPSILRVHNFALNCISEVRNSKCCQGLFQTLKCYRFVLEKTLPPPSLLLGQKQILQWFPRCENMFCFISVISEESQNSTGRSKMAFVGRSNIFY